MNNPGLIKNFIAGNDIAAKHIVCITDADQVVQADAGHTANLGVAELGGQAGSRVDVVMSGIAEVQAGDNIACGDFVTANGDGAAMRADEGCFVLGVALSNASSGDYFPVRISPNRPINIQNQKYGFEAASAIEYGRLVTFDGSGKAVQASASSDTLVGVSLFQADTGQFCDLALSGIARATAGAAVAVGAYVTADSNGRAVTATAGANYIGIALEAAAAADDEINIAIRPGSIAAE